MLDALDHQMTAALRAADFDLFEQLATQAETAHAERGVRLTAPDALAGAAAWYARAGIPVFPLQPGAKVPLFPSPHPADSLERRTCRGECGQFGHGLYDARTDLITITALWTDHPTANIGIPTGGRFDVIDIDGPAGWHSYGLLREAGALPPVLGSAWTRRGKHLYIAPSGDGNATRFRPGLDYRGTGGYVVAPPSVVDGRRYEWDQPVAT